MTIPDCVPDRGDELGGVVVVEPGDCVTEVAPVPVSSGRTDWHRLHRGGDRDANSALWRIALVRMHCHQPTKDYIARRIAEGRTRKEILPCLKRYIARETYSLRTR
jgi:hypothetical protein